MVAEMQLTNTHDIGLASEKTQKAHTVIIIEGWILWNWDDGKTGDGWHLPYAMFHRCGQATSFNPQHNGVKRREDGSYTCSRCARVPPVGMVAAYEFMNWEAKGFGG